MMAKRRTTKSARLPGCQHGAVEQLRDCGHGPRRAVFLLRGVAAAQKGEKGRRGQLLAPASFFYACR